VESSCECGNESSGFIKCLTVVEWLHNWWPLELMLISMELFSFSTPPSAEVKTAGAIRLFPISLHGIMVK
jgi:hypothetical protein